MVTLLVTGGGSPIFWAIPEFIIANRGLVFRSRQPGASLYHHRHGNTPHSTAASIVPLTVHVTIHHNGLGLLHIIPSRQIPRMSHRFTPRRQGNLIPPLRVVLVLLRVRLLPLSLPDQSPQQFRHFFFVFF